MQVRAPRSNSLGRDKNKKEAKLAKETGEFKRSSSVKAKKDKAKEKVEESIKPSHPEKEKGWFPYHATLWMLIESLF